MDKKKIIVTALIVIICSLPSIIFAQMQEHKPSEKLSNKARNIAYKRETKIKQEILQLGEHQWAGEYHKGKGIGTNFHLTLAPKLGFVSELRGCVGSFGVSYGKVLFENGILKLISLGSTDQTDKNNILEFYSIQWGERHYLIACDEIIDFCNAVNSGLEPYGLFSSGFLLKVDDREKTVVGQPNLPKQFQSYLLVNALIGKIISVEKIYTKVDPYDSSLKYQISEVTLDIGKAEGLLTGMELRSYDPPNAETARVFDVQEHTSKAEIIRLVFKGEEPNKPEIGWHFSTRLLDKFLSPK